jgi:hypothetical protein
MSITDTIHSTRPGLPIWRERQCRHGRHRSIIVTRAVGARITGIDQDGRPVRMSRSTLFRGWAQVGTVDLNAVDTAQFIIPPAEVHEVVFRSMGPQTQEASFLLVPCLFARGEKTAFFAFVSEPGTKTFRPFRPVYDGSADAYVPRPSSGPIREIEQIA